MATVQCYYTSKLNIKKCPKSDFFIVLSILLCQSVLRSQVFPNISLMETNDICRICLATILCWTRRGTKTLKKHSYFKRFPHSLRRKYSINKFFGVFEVSIKSFLPHWMRSLLIILCLRQVPHHMRLVNDPVHLYPLTKMMETLNFCIMVLLGVLVQDKE